MTYHLYVWPHRELIQQEELFVSLGITCNIFTVFLSGQSWNTVETDDFQCRLADKHDPCAYFLFEDLTPEDEIMLRIKGELLYTCNNDTVCENEYFTIDGSIIKGVKEVRDELTRKKK